jgi:hypothetical protein
MTLQEQLLDLSKTFPSPLEENKDGTLSLEFIVAERKSFLTRKKLLYRCRLRLDDQIRAVKFFEILKESGFGLGGGGDGDLEPGFSFKKETYKMSGKEREGTIEELSRFFGQEYKYSFDYSTIRNSIKKAAEEAGYSFSLYLREKSL